jgi:hypothetical protein
MVQLPRLMTNMALPRTLLPRRCTYSRVARVVVTGVAVDVDSQDSVLHSVVTLI